MMTLYWSSRSPYVRKVMVAAYEIGVQDRLTLVRKDIAILKPDDAVIAANPLGKIPALVLENGTTLFESSLICEFLDGLGPAPLLFPPDQRGRLAALRLHATGNGLMDLMVIARAERMRPDGSRSAAHVAAYHRKMITTLDRLEVEAHTLTNAPFSIGTLTIGCALSYGDFRSADIGLAEKTGWRESRPALASWHESFCARASVQATQHSDVY
jgi:glutathione S-transferase